VFIIGPDKKIKLMLFYPMTTGRNFDEILRALDALQVNDSGPFSTPVDWKVGERIIVAPTVTTEDAQARFKGVEVVKPYLRYAEAPSA
jgi:alkyl hydroperoxide reductase subunit AhpC